MRQQQPLFRCEARIKKGKGRRCKRHARVFSKQGSFCRQHAEMRGQP